MNKQDVKQKIYSGSQVQCSLDEYPDVRRYLQEIAAESIDTGQTIYAAIALAEVTRLDGVSRVAEQRNGAAEIGHSGLCRHCGSELGENDACPRNCPRS